MDQSTDPPGEGGNSIVGRAQQRASRFENASRLYRGPQNTNPVQVMPYQVQAAIRTDQSGRQYMALTNTPGGNYVAGSINSGGELAIGGSASFIVEALDNQLAWRVVQDAKNKAAESLWHVIVLPDSAMSNAPRFDSYGLSPEILRWPAATALRPMQASTSNGPPAPLPQQYPYASQQPLLLQGNQGAHQQPVPAHNTPMGGYAQVRPSVAPSQWSQFSTPMPGNFQSRSASVMALPQQQSYSHIPTQGSLQGVGLNSGPAQGNFQGHSSNAMFYPSGGPRPTTLPQAHRPIFDRNGYIVGEQGNTHGGSLYGGNVHGGNIASAPRPIPFQAPQQQLNPAQQQFNPPEQLQDVTASNPQLAAEAKSFFSFVEQQMKQDKNFQAGSGHGGGGNQHKNDEGGVEQDDRDQDEGIALGNTSNLSEANTNMQQAAVHQPDPRPQSSSTEPPLASSEELSMLSDGEAHPFGDYTGTDCCDYCGREGHEAADCIKWDPDHFDKPVCTACNNSRHGLDECPKFGAMPSPQREALLLGRGARRPGVRSEKHAWTSYVRRGGGQDGGELPLTRLYLRNLSADKDTGSVHQNLWKVWDYGRGVPDQLRDPSAESLSGNPSFGLDERFMGGKHRLGGKMPVPKSFPPAVGQKRTWEQSSLPQAENATEEAGYEAELWNTLV